MRFIPCLLRIDGTLELRIQAVDILACYDYRSCTLYIQDNIILYSAIMGKDKGKDNMFVFTSTHLTPVAPRKHFGMMEHMFSTLNRR